MNPHYLLVKLSSCLLSNKTESKSDWPCFKQLLHKLAKLDLAVNMMVLPFKGINKVQGHSVTLVCAAVMPLHLKTLIERIE